MTVPLGLHLLAVDGDIDGPHRHRGLATAVRLRAPTEGCDPEFVSWDHDHVDGEACQLCGRPASATDRHVRFSWPDALLEAAQHGLRIEELWLSHDTVESSVMMQTSEAAFVRVLLPIRLDDLSTITYSVWFRVELHDMHRAFLAWTGPQYSQLRLEGRLANDIPPGQALDARGVAVVRDPDQTPYLDDSNDPMLNRLLAEVWPAALHV
nr:DUF2199 domain-containing protein [Kineococcus siccus]